MVNYLVRGDRRVFGILARSSVNRRGVIKMDFYVKRGAKKGDREWFLYHDSKKNKGQIEELV